VIELRVEVAPAWPFRLARASGMDGVLKVRRGVLHRLLHHGLDERPAVVRVAQTARDRVLLGAQAPDRAAAAWGIERMRFALGLDDDLRPFHVCFRDDPLIGAAVRADPTVRLRRRPEPFEALAWAITEQLIEAERAASIQRRLVWRYGRRSACATLRDAPSPAALAGRAPAELEACDLAGKRAIAMVRVAREVAAGRADLTQHEPTWKRLRSIREIGTWTIEKLAYHGQGRDDCLPAGDLAYVKLVGRLTGLGRRATEDEVRAFFERYAPFQALAGTYLLRAPAPAGTRW